jgi:hypothetical protein
MGVEVAKTYEIESGAPYRVMLLLSFGFTGGCPGTPEWTTSGADDSGLLIPEDALAA